MKIRRIQFGLRENTASPRQQASRLRVEPHSNAVCIEEQSPDKKSLSSQSELPAKGFDNPRHAASQFAATEGETRDDSHLLTVHEVAELLQVPVSWVYERTRQRCRERIPGFRLGKYWRFEAADIAEWLLAKRTNDYHNARESQ